ncbi:hypothetical protein ACFY4C_13985 [Actinomadura viridis]|uniref:hypothetical protein n=1 Tax=Actinomadura viridis TaxID=58110 RepID=UPI0036CD1F4B
MNAPTPGAIRVGYTRCSTDEQDVVVQTEQMLGLGVPPDRIYIDRGFSGTRPAILVSSRNRCVRIHGG